MKKTMAMMLVVFMTILSAVTVLADYPASPEWDWELPKEGSILIGETFGTEAWGGSTDNTYDKAWDGNTDTFFDPLEVGEHCYTGMKLDKAYILTEIRIMPRSANEARYNGATIQGSNDGETWTDIYLSVEAAPGIDYQIITPDMFEADSNTGFSQYRYVNNTNHGDVAEVELYGVPADGAAEAPAETTPAETEAPAETTPAETEAPVEAPTETEAPATGDMTVVLIVVAAVALTSTAVIIGKKKSVK